MAAGQCVGGSTQSKPQCPFPAWWSNRFLMCFLMEVYGTWIYQGLDTLTLLLRIHSLLFFSNIEYHQNWNLKCKNRKHAPACGSCSSAANFSFLTLVKLRVCAGAPLGSPNATCLLEEPLCGILETRWTWSQTLTLTEGLLFLTLALSSLAAWYQLLAV